EPVENGARAPVGDDRVQEFAKALQEAPKGRGFLLLTSCSRGEASYEEPEWGHGVFTYYLMEGLGGAADVRGRGYVSMLDLYQYATEKTRTYVAKVKKEVQRPTLRGEIEEDFTIGVLGAATGPASPPSTGKPNKVMITTATKGWHDSDQREEHYDLKYIRIGTPATIVDIDDKKDMYFLKFENGSKAWVRQDSCS